MAVTSTSIFMVEPAHKKIAAISICVPRVNCLQLHLVSPGGDPRPTGGSDPATSKITASDLGPRVCEILFGTIALYSLHPLRMESLWDFPGVPVAQIPHFQCRAPGV